MKITYLPLFVATIVISVLSAALIFLLRPEDPYPVVTYALAIPALALFVFWLARKQNLHPTKMKQLALLSFLIVLLNAPGTIYFHVDGFLFQYDRLLHFSVGFLLLPFVTILLEILRPSFSGQRVLQQTAAIVSLCGLFLWEGWQYINDLTFGTHMFFDYGQDISLDVFEDITLGMAGLVLWMLVRWKARSTIS